MHRRALVWLLTTLVLAGLLLLLALCREGVSQHHRLARVLHQRGGMSATPWWLPWVLAGLVFVAFVALLVLQGGGPSQGHRARGLARGVHRRAPMFATPWRTRRRRSSWRSWLLLLLALAALAALAPPGCPPLLAQRPGLVRRLQRRHPGGAAVDPDRDWLPWVVGALTLLIVVAFLALLLLPVGPAQGRLARGLQDHPGVGRTPWWLPWLLAGLVTLAVVAFLVALQQAGLQGAVARALHSGRGMNTPPSAWALGWAVLGALTAGLLAAVQALQRAAGLPQRSGEGAVDRDWLPWLVAVLVMLALLGLLLLVAQGPGPQGAEAGGAVLVRPLVLPPPAVAPQPGGAEGPRLLLDGLVGGSGRGHGPRAGPR